MASILDIFAAANKMIGENGEAIARLPQFFDEWLRFMQRIGAQLERIEMRLDMIDSKLQSLLVENNLTPELHATVMQMAQNDPRNMIGGLDNDGRQLGRQ